MSAHPGEPMTLIVLDSEGVVLVPETMWPEWTRTIEIAVSEPLSINRNKDPDSFAVPYWVVRAHFEQFRDDGTAVFRREADFRAVLPQDEPTP